MFRAKVGEGGMRHTRRILSSFADMNLIFKGNIGSFSDVSIYIKETKSATMNIFRKIVFSFLNHL